MVDSFVGVSAMAWAIDRMIGAGKMGVALCGGNRIRKLTVMRLHALHASADGGDDRRNQKTEGAD
jgi:hypothetical protein